MYNSKAEFQPASEREQSLLNKLPEFIDYAKSSCPHYQSLLADVNATDITSRAALAKLPITRKSVLLNLQKRNFPFGGLAAEQGNISRIFQSPGPIYDPESDASDWWRMGQAFDAAGFKQGDIVQNCLSYHLTPGGFILDSGARACGCSVIPAGPGQTEQQLDVIEHLKPQGYCGTPSFLKIILDKAKAQSRDVSSLTKALVTGEAFLPSQRAEFAEQGISVVQAYATADIGLIGYESAGYESTGYESGAANSESNQGLIIAEDIIVEIVRPGSLEPVVDGEVGEVVVTSFNPDYPLIRFATGDLSAVQAGQSPCGRTNMCIKGWMGRADQTTKIKGMFVHPEQIEKVRLSYLADNPSISKARLVVTNDNGNDQMHLICELACEVDIATIDSLPEKTALIASSLKQVTKLSGTVEFVGVGELPDDGVVIEDKRSFD